MSFSQIMISRHWPESGRGLLLLVSLSGLLGLTACSSVPPELEVRTVPIEIERPDPTPPLPLPRPVDLQDVDFVVLTPDNIPEGDDWVFVAVTPEGYEQLSLNQAELLRYLKEARYQLLYYRGEGR